MAATIVPVLQDALAAVRRDGSDVNWALAGYENNTTIGLIGQGNGGVEELIAHLRDDDVCYGLLRQSFTFEKVGAVQADTVKFVFIYWRPENIPMARKMKIGVFEGQVKRLFSPYHADLEAGSRTEVTPEIVANLLDSVTMRGNRVTDAKPTTGVVGGRRAGTADESKAAPAKAMTGTSADNVKAAAGANVSFEDPAALQADLADVRNDATPTNWCLYGYKSKSVLGAVGKGTGGFTEMVSSFEDGNVNYGLLRVTEAYESTEVVRFVFFSWQPEDVPPTKRALISTHRGTVNGAFRPYMCEFVMAARTDLSEHDVMNHIGGLTGTKSHVTERKAEGKREEKFERKMLGGLAPTVQQLEFEDESALRQAIADVRRDASPDDYVVAKFHNNKLTLVSTGATGLAGIARDVDPEALNYALLRLTEIIDNSRTTKFCYIRYQAETVPAQVKGRLGVLAGAVAAVFHPYHGDIFVTDTAELSVEACMAAVSNLRAHK